MQKNTSNEYIFRYPDVWCKHIGNANNSCKSKKLNAAFYFANPYASWERGLNEYTNKLIKQYIPKGTDFDTITDQQITEIQHKINRRPREKLNFEIPKKLFYKLVA